MNRINKAVITVASIAMILVGIYMLNKEELYWGLSIILTGTIGLTTANWSYLASKYKSNRLKGEVTFDYSQNGGFFLIGTGELEFNTKWTRGDAMTIHFYKANSGIKNIGLVRDVYRINELSNARDHIDSSPNITPQEHQIVIIENVYGNYAAIKIIDIKSSLHGDNKDELTFGYVINPNGGTDFR